MANLLPGALSLELLASVPGLLEVLGSWITEKTFGWYLPILDFATLLGKGKPELSGLSELGGLSGSACLRQETKQVPERNVGPCLKKTCTKELLSKGTPCAQRLCVLGKDEFVS